MIQIWTSLITILILKVLKAQSKFGWHLSNLVAFIRFNLFVKIELKNGLTTLLKNMLNHHQNQFKGFFFK
jgi:hypothetical protein